MSVREPSEELRRRQRAAGIDEATLERVAKMRDALTSEAEARLANKGEDANESGTRNKRRSAEQNSAAGAKRAKVGASFEEQLEDTHDGMLQRGEGRIYRHHPPTRHAGPGGMRRLIAGGAEVDFSGHVNLELALPVAFDAKVLGEAHATYRHDPKLMHQLDSLRRARDAGAAAFLLVRADALERVFLVSFDEYGEQLRRGDGVTLYRQERDGWSEEARLGKMTRVPRYKASTLLPAVTYTIGRGWLWRELLQPPSAAVLRPPQ